MRRALPDRLFQPSARSLWWVPFHLAVIVGGYVFLSRWFQPWLAPLVALAIGHSFACLGFLAHDVSHGGAFRNRTARDLFTLAAFSPLWIGPLLWRKWHNAEHHNNTQIEGVDPDHLFTIEHYKHNPVLRFLYRLSPLARNLVVFGSFTFRMTQQTIRMLIAYVRDPATPVREKSRMLAETVGQAAFWIGLSLTLGGTVFVWGYVVPLLVANTVVISYIATNHFLNPLADERDVLASSLSVSLPKWLGWLDAMHHYFGAHVAHHLFPAAPPHHAREIERKVAELYPDRFYTMPLFTALRLLWQTPWVYEDGVNLVDPHRGERHPTLGHGLERQIEPTVGRSVESKS
ncbi:MAG: fatty acid desaturase [Fimbriimonadaceae bacterium]|nr:fatty acid desaturase [Fimbriimonadaceae bacterium]